MSCRQLPWNRRHFQIKKFTHLHVTLGSTHFSFYVILSYSTFLKWSCSVMSDSLQPHGLQPPRLLRPWNFPGKSSGVGCHFLLQKWLINLETQSFLKVHLFYKPEYIPTTAKALSMTLFPPPHFTDGRSCEETYIWQTNNWEGTQHH